MKSIPDLDLTILDGRFDRPNQLKVIILQDNDYRRAFVGSPGTYSEFLFARSWFLADDAFLFFPLLSFRVWDFSGGEKIWCAFQPSFGDCGSIVADSLILNRSTLCVSLLYVSTPSHPFASKLTSPSSFRLRAFDQLGYSYLFAADPHLVGEPASVSDEGSRGRSLTFCNVFRPQPRSTACFQT